MALFLSHYYGDPKDIVDTVHLHVRKIGLRISYAHDGWINSKNKKSIKFQIELKKDKIEMFLSKFAVVLEIN